MIYRMRWKEAADMLHERDREVHYKADAQLFFVFFFFFIRDLWPFLDIFFSFENTLDQGRAISTGGGKANHKGTTRGKAESKSLRTGYENVPPPVPRAFFSLFVKSVNSHINDPLFLPCTNSGSKRVLSSLLAQLQGKKGLA